LSEIDQGPGTLLRIYLWCVEQNRPVGPREVMRAFSMSSPSTAYYYLNRLVQLGLLERRAGEYIVIRKVNIEGFLWVGRKLIPRLLIYSAFFAGMAVVFAIALITDLLKGGLGLSIHAPPLVVSLIATLIMGYEGLRALGRLKGKR